MSISVIWKSTPFPVLLLFCIWSFNRVLRFILDLHFIFSKTPSHFNFVLLINIICSHNLLIVLKNGWQLDTIRFPWSIQYAWSVSFLFLFWLEWKCSCPSRRGDGRLSYLIFRRKHILGLFSRPWNWGWRRQLVNVWPCLSYFICDFQGHFGPGYALMRRISESSIAANISCSYNEGLRRIFLIQ